MTLPVLLYLADVLNNINSILSVMFIMAGTVFGIIAFFWFMTGMSDSFEAERNPATPVMRQLAKKWWLAFILALILVFTPSQRTIYLMLGAKYLSESNVPAKVAEALELKLDDVLDDLRKKDRK